jgi:uncharacterized protein YgiM (DUF1202 family)
MTARLTTTVSTLLLLGGLMAASPLAHAQTAAAPAAATPVTGTATVRTTIAHLRAEPTTKSTVLATLNQGTKLQVIGASGDWTQVQAGDKTGYVNNKLLTKKP